VWDTRFQGDQPWRARRVSGCCSAIRAASPRSWSPNWWQAGQNYTPFFETDTKAKIATKLSFMQVCGESMQRYFGRPFDRKGVDQMKAQQLAVKYCHRYIYQWSKF
jgi:hypothetical protein